MSEPTAPGQAPARLTTSGAPADPAFVDDATVVAESVSVWFGAKVALSELSCSFGPGVTGLLGPNGAGKTTLMRAVTGLSDVNQGSVRVNGRDPRAERAVLGTIALVPEDEAVPGNLTAAQFVGYTAALHGIRGRGAVDAALHTVALGDVAGRRVDGFSKGMRQRAKIAAALVTDPQVLVLDEPLNGADPVQRLALIALFKQLGDAGRTVIVSSHVLSEVERMAERVIVVVSGRLAAAGNRRAIREAMNDRPRHVLIRSSDDRRLAAALVGVAAVSGITLHTGLGTELGGDTSANTLVVESRSAGDLAAAIAPTARAGGIRLYELRPLDDSLESLFRELLR